MSFAADVVSIVVKSSPPATQLNLMIGVLNDELTSPKIHMMHVHGANGENSPIMSGLRHENARADRSDHRRQQERQHVDAGTDRTVIIHRLIEHGNVALGAGQNNVNRKR
jgi:hypothetical protein